MSGKELKDLLKILRANGVTKYVTSTIQLELVESQEALPSAQKVSSSELNDYSTPSEDDLLFYSSSVDTFSK